MKPYRLIQFSKPVPIPTTSQFIVSHTRLAQSPSNLIFSSPRVGERDTNGIFEVNYPSATRSQGRKSLTAHKGLSRFDKHMSHEGLKSLPIKISDNVFLLIHGV